MSEETGITTETTPGVDPKAKSIIFKSLKVGQLFYKKDEKNHPVMDIQFVKQTKEAAMVTGKSVSELITMEPKTKCSIFYNIREFTKKDPKV